LEGIAALEAVFDLAVRVDLYVVVLGMVSDHSHELMVGGFVAVVGIELGSGLMAVFGLGNTRSAGLVHNAVLVHSAFLARSEHLAHFAYAPQKGEGIRLVDVEEVAAARHLVAHTLVNS
jgi:hypothetical protein